MAAKTISGITTVHRGKSMEELRADLAHAMDQLGAGELTPAVANARVNLVAAHLRTLKMSMDYAKAVGKTPNLPLLAAELVTDGE